jgi:hypothetical protein
MASETTTSEKQEHEDRTIAGLVGWFGGSIFIGIGTGSICVAIGVFLAIMAVVCAIGEVHSQINAKK